MLLRGLARSLSRSLAFDAYYVCKVVYFPGVPGNSPGDVPFPMVVGFDEDVGSADCINAVESDSHIASPSSAPVLPYELTSPCKSQVAAVMDGARRDLGEMCPVPAI